MTTTAEPDLLDRLRRCCLDADEETRYPALKAPFAYARDDQTFAVATDGHLLVMVAYDGELPEAPVDLDPIFAQYRPTGLLVDVAALAAFAGKAEYFWRHEDCDDCQGHWPQVRRGFLGDVLCDLNLLARGLELITDERAELAITEETAPIFLRWSAGWIALMPMRYEGETGLPRFEIPVEAQQ